MSNDIQDLSKITMDEIRSAIYMTPTERDHADARHIMSCVFVSVAKHLLPHDKPIPAKEFTDMVLHDNPSLTEMFAKDPETLDDALVEALKLVFCEHEIVEATIDQGRAFIVKQDPKSVSL